ncbi:MAG: hypothetical protein AAF402_05255 [Pseudomonadota bacterium]
MNFKFYPIPKLPSLAWIAVAKRGENTVIVKHGTRVETCKQFFVEGAWDDNYHSGRFDTSVVFMGTGARVTENGIVFCSPSHNLERCYSIKKSEELYVSNSLGGLMAAAGEELDPNHPFYYFDYIRCYRTGLRQTGHSLKVLSGRKILLHDCHNIRVDRNLTIESSMRSFGEPPLDFSDYFSFISESTNRLLANAADSIRSFAYKPLASISRGYDSPATSVLAASFGCEDAFSFRKSHNMDNLNYADDNGREIAEFLGMRCHEADRIDLCDAPVSLLKQHFQNPFGSIVSSMDQVSSLLEGRIFITGRHGEHFWNLDRSRSLPNYQEPTARKTLVQNTLEFRLSRGYIDFHLPYTLGVFAPALLKISRSSEMRKFRIGGSYDRPIPRRIVESAGVSRDKFGQNKMGGAEAGIRKCSFSKAAQEDFYEFYKDYVPEPIRDMLHESKHGRFRFYEHGVAHGLDRWLRKQYGLRTISEHVLGFRNHQRRHSPFLYAFHWGFYDIRNQYQLALSDPSVNSAQCT